METDYQAQVLVLTNELEALKETVRLQVEKAAAEADTAREEEERREEEMSGLRETLRAEREAHQRELQSLLQSTHRRRRHQPLQAVQVRTAVLSSKTRQLRTGKVTEYIFTVQCTAILVYR